jgi:hypothetical protein
VRGSKPPFRQVTARAQRREILAFVEGRETEERYLTHWARRHRDRVLVTIDPFRGGPLQLVEHAVEAKKRDERDAKRGRGKPYDEIWCVFDIDEHPNIESARSLAERNDIALAVSNPCIELWFLLHFAERFAYLDRYEAQRLARAHLGAGKVLHEGALETLTVRIEDATRRAQKLEEKHEGDGSPLGANPGSGMWRLVDRIRNA